MSDGTGERRLGVQILSKVAMPAIFLAGFLALWQLAVSGEWITQLILPPPADVVTSFFSLITGGEIWGDVWATTWEAIAGFVVAAAFGFILAMGCALSRPLRDMLYPWVISLQVTPVIAIAPILIAWLGFGLTPKVVIAALIAFFPVFVNAMTGMLAVDESEREMFRSLGASRRQTFTNLMLPTSLPFLFAGLKAAITLALVGAIVGEFISADKGMGLLIGRFSNNLNMDDAMAVLVMLTLLGLALYAVVEVLNRIFVFWTHDGRMAARTRRRVRRDERRRARKPGGAGPTVSGPRPGDAGLGARGGQVS